MSITVLRTSITYAHRSLPPTPAACACSASGHVYVAKTLSSGKKVAIKEMDLSAQPRKELIVNEILVMKESQHPNIVNFLESYLVKGSDLWVVMEYMEGGALTDVIENNTLEEDQISSICFEVGHLAFRASVVGVTLTDFLFFFCCSRRRAKDWVTFTAKVSSIVILNRITYSWMRKDELRLVR